QLIKHSGKSIVQGRQDAAHVHSVVFPPAEDYLFVADLGTDEVTKYKFNSSSANTPLTTDNDSIIHSTAGNGPRHTIFSSNNKYAYIINELAGTIDVFEYNKGKTNLIQTISTDTSNRKDKGSADIHLSPDGKFLYATNRGNDNSISAYKVNNNGKLEW